MGTESVTIEVELSRPKSAVKFNPVMPEPKPLRQGIQFHPRVRTVTAMSGYDMGSRENYVLSTNKSTGYMH